MLNVRREIAEMKDLGPLPSEDDDDFQLLKKYGELYRGVVRPVTDAEARVLFQLFGPDGCYGLASSIMHLIETAPGWPLEDCLVELELDNEWKVEMRNRVVRAGLLRS